MGISLRRGHDEWLARLGRTHFWLKDNGSVAGFLPSRDLWNFVFDRELTEWKVFRQNDELVRVQAVRSDRRSGPRRGAAYAAEEFVLVRRNGGSEKKS